jgi:hypothetical protein
MVVWHYFKSKKKPFPSCRERLCCAFISFYAKFILIWTKNKVFNIQQTFPHGATTTPEPAGPSP